MFKRNCRKRKDSSIRENKSWLLLTKGCPQKNWPPKTAIEVQCRLHYSSISWIYQQYLPLFEAEEVSKLVIIYIARIDNSNLNRYLESLNTSFIELYDFRQDLENKTLVENKKSIINRTFNRRLEFFNIRIRRIYICCSSSITFIK